MDYRIINKIICFLEGDYFKGALTLMSKNNGQGLLKVIINFLLMQLYAWGMSTHHDLPS